MKLLIPTILIILILISFRCQTKKSNIEHFFQNTKGNNLEKNKNIEKKNNNKEKINLQEEDKEGNKINAEENKINAENNNKEEKKNNNKETNNLQEEDKEENKINAEKNNKEENKINSEDQDKQNNKEENKINSEDQDKQNNKEENNKEENKIIVKQIYRGLNNINRVENNEEETNDDDFFVKKGTISYFVSNYNLNKLNDNSMEKIEQFLKYHNQGRKFYITHVSDGKIYLNFNPANWNLQNIFEYNKNSGEFEIIKTKGVRTSDLKLKITKINDTNFKIKDNYGYKTEVHLHSNLPIYNSLLFNLGEFKNGKNKMEWVIDLLRAGKTYEDIFHLLVIESKEFYKTRKKSMKNFVEKNKNTQDFTTKKVLNIVDLSKSLKIK